MEISPFFSLIIEIDYYYHKKTDSDTDGTHKIHTDTEHIQIVQKDAQTITNQ